MPDWDKIQHPEQKSKEHGKKDAQHNEHERGLGGKRTPDVEKAKHGQLASVSQPLAGATIFPSYYYVASTPPVTDQGSTPQCVAYADAYDQNQHDRPELGRFNQLNHALFFQQIGGDSNGSYLYKALDQRQAVGYPEKVSVPAAGGYPSQDANVDTGTHRIASSAEVALSVEALKNALYGRKHGILVIGPWFHSWFHPFASGKLPAPDYEVGGHCTWWRGWNDTYGFRIRNSWGTDYGLSGDVFLPYAYLPRLWEAWVTTDTT